jgi:hypothetical protein
MEAAWTSAIVRCAHSRILPCPQVQSKLTAAANRDVSEAVGWIR